MYYVEMLRVVRGLKIFAIILGSLFLLAVVVRISINRQLDPQKYMGSSPTAVKTVRVERDGSKTTIIDDRAKRTHVEIHQGAFVYRITITDRTNPASYKRSRSRNDWHEVGSGASMSEKDVPGVGHVTTIERTSNLPLDTVLMIASFLTAFMATVFGNALSKENEHLELAWTKPVSRERYALTAIGIDVAGLLASFVLCLCAIIAISSLFGIPHLLTSTQTPLTAAFALLFPLSWYAVLQGMTASLRRAQLVLGLSWPVAFALAAVAQIKWSLQPVLQLLDTFNPVAYFTRASAGNDAGTSALTLLHYSSDWVSAVMLCVLTAIGIGAALVQWRRVEA